MTRRYRVRVTKTYDIDVVVEAREDCADERVEAEILASEASVPNQLVGSTETSIVESYDDPLVTTSWNVSPMMRAVVLVFKRRSGSGGFTQEECDVLYERAAALFNVSGHWNGSPTATYCVCLDAPAEAVLKEWTSQVP